MDEDKFKYQYHGLKWLYEMELLDDPQLINNLKLNIFSVSTHIKEVQFLMSQEERKMLIHVELSWWGKKFKEAQISQDITEVMSQLLSNYKFRITTNDSIFKLAVSKVKKSIRGGTYAISRNDSNGNVNSEDKSIKKSKV